MNVKYDLITSLWKHDGSSSRFELNLFRLQIKHVRHTGNLSIRASYIFSSNYPIGEHLHHSRRL